MPHLRRAENAGRSLRHLRRLALLTLLCLVGLGVVSAPNVGGPGGHDQRPRGQRKH